MNYTEVSMCLVSRHPGRVTADSAPIWCERDHWETFCIHGVKGLLSNSKYKFYRRLRNIWIEAPVRILAKKFLCRKELKLFLQRENQAEVQESATMGNYGQAYDLFRTSNGLRWKSFPVHDIASKQSDGWNVALFTKRDNVGLYKYNHKLQPYGLCMVIKQ
jgi:hypothetical protein